MKNKKPGFSTRAIHSGQEADPLTGAVTVPIYATSTYVQEEIGKNKGYEYARVSNPTRTRLEENLAALEGGRSAHVFASGMAAINALCTMLKSGDHVVCSSNVYGGVPRLFGQILSGYGLKFSYVDTSDTRAVAASLRKNTKFIYVETPTNPLMAISDIRAIADVCHKKNVEVIVDNTFLSPYFQQPLALGADMVVHSTTKFLNGHSDGLGGVVVGTKPEHAERFAFIQKSAGAILSPFECWLVLRGVKTLAVRMVQHDFNGRLGRRFSPATQESEAGILSGAERTSPARARQAPDDWFWLDDYFRDRVARQCSEDVAQSPYLLAGGIAGRRGNSDIAPCHHDPRRGGGCRQGEDRDYRWHGPSLRRYRGLR